MRETLCTIDWERLVRVLAALLTPIIAIVTSYIAFQQYQTNRRQLRLALFDKRMVIFNSVMNLIATVQQDAEVQFDHVAALLRETRHYEFLFGPEVGDYITEVFTKGTQLRARVERGIPPEKTQELIDWFSDQGVTAKEKFRKYVEFSKS